MNSLSVALEPVRELLADASSLYRDRPHIVAQLQEQLARFDQPVRVAVAGPRGIGKSTMVNALLGDQLAPAYVTGLEPPFVRYQDGPALRVSMLSPGRPTHDVPAFRTDTGLRLEPPGAGSTPLDRAVVESPGKLLRDLTIIDTPALAEVSSSEDSVLGRLAGEADAVVYLVRYPEPEQLLGLGAGHSMLARAMKVNSLLVLARADEMGAGRVDALLAAKQLARKSSRESDLCADFQGVMAVSAQLGYAAKTMSDEDFAALGLLTGIEREELNRILLSVDSFVAEDFPVELTVSQRRMLLNKFSLAGIRLATTLLRTGSDTLIKLSAQLAQRSGLSELRDALIMYFADRKEVLKIRSALLAVDAIVRAEPRLYADTLVDQMEKILLNNHDFRELRLISDINSARIVLPDSLSEEALRLAGAQGVSVQDRLGLSIVDESNPGLDEAAASMLRKWRQLSEHAETLPSVRAAARVVARTCEGIIAVRGVF